MALKRNKQVSVETGLKRGKSNSPKTLLDFFKDNNQDILQMDTRPEGSASEDEMTQGDEEQQMTEEKSRGKAAPVENKTKLVNSMSEDELLNATLVDYEALLRKSKQKGSNAIENESERGPKILQGNELAGVSNALLAPKRVAAKPLVQSADAVLPLSRENKHELEVLAEIRELIKSASSNLNKPAIDYINKYNQLEQRHRMGLGENRVNDAAMKQVAYDDEYPKKENDGPMWPTTRYKLTDTAGASATSLPSHKKESEDSPSTGISDDDSTAKPTKSVLQSHEKLKIRLTPSSIQKDKSKTSKATIRVPSKGNAVVKDLGNNSDNLLLTLMRKMQSIKERVDDDTKSYSGGVSLGAVFQGDTPVKGKLIICFPYRSKSMGRGEPF